MAQSVVVENFKQGYAALFERNWPLWIGGVLFALLGVVALALGRPWGVAGGLRVWGDWIFYGLGIYSQAPSQSLFFSYGAVLTWGLLFGAFGAALLSGQFALRMAPGLELIKGLVGGILMGAGSVLAGGCNVGGFYSALAAGSVSGFAMMAGLLLGAVAGLKYLLWEIENIPSKPPKPAKPKGEGGVDWKKAQPWLGAAFFAFLIIMSYVTSLCGITYYTKSMLLMLVGAGFGLVIQRCRFCFVRAFRDPFMTGEAEATRAVALSVMLSATAFFAVKWFHPDLAGLYTYHHWIGGLVGGVIFGFGMLLAGGCGSGSVWRAGEGQIKLIIAVVAFAMVNSLLKKTILTSAVVKKWGAALFLPDVVGGYFWALLITCLVMIVWWAVMAWNEETDKLTLT